MVRHGNAVDQGLGRYPSARTLHPAVRSASSATECAFHPCPPSCFCGRFVGRYGAGSFLIKVVAELLQRKDCLGLRLCLALPLVASWAGWLGWLTVARSRRRRVVASGGPYN